jgi:hypothetical protein
MLPYSILVARFSAKTLKALVRTLHARLCGVREKSLNGVDKYLFTSFQQRRQHLPAAHHDHDQEQISTPSHIHTSHSTQTTSQSWATEQKQPQSASATPKMPETWPSLSSNQYVFFFCFHKRAALSKRVIAFHIQCTNACIQNILAKSIKCKICFQDFQSTAKRPALEEHASNKHSKKYEDCFPAAA